MITTTFRRLSEVFKRMSLKCILLQGDGFVIVRGNDRWLIPWEKVYRVTARKFDLITTDAIGLSFHVDQDDNIYDVHEDIEGYQELSQELLRRFPQVSPGWESKIALPAFLPNPYVIYERS